MSEEQVSATGQFPALSSADFATSYQAPDSAPRQSVSATSAAQTLSEAAATVTSTATAAKSAAAAASQSAKQASAQEISDAVAAANVNLASSNRTLDYRVDAVTGLSITTIRNSQTGVVVQQIPGADIIALATMLADWSPGKHVLLDLIA